MADCSLQSHGMNGRRTEIPCGTPQKLRQRPNKSKNQINQTGERNQWLTAL
jgi:hypothetical protein